MAQTKQLVGILKQQLKRYGLSYSDVARHLNLSEASVKRLFSDCSFSLSRMDEICQLMALEISDLVNEMNKQQLHSMVTELTWQQEEKVANDPVLLLVAVCVLNHWSIEEILDHYRLTEPECIAYLIMLEKIQLIELLPKNKIKLKVASNFKWLPNGPIQQFFQQKLAADFFDSRFDKQGEELIVINGMLSNKTMSVFQHRLQQLVSEFSQLSQEESSLSLQQRQGYTAVFAVRHWQYGLFDGMRKV